MYMCIHYIGLAIFCGFKVHRGEGVQDDVHWIHGYLCAHVHIRCIIGKRDSIHHHLLEVTFGTATVSELRQRLLYTTPSGWWWCIESVFRIIS